MKRLAPLALAVLAAVLAAGCSKREPEPGASSAPGAAQAPAVSGIAWERAAGDAEVDAAFARAKAENKPVFVYWGAKWCPPCNQLQATLFNRQDFIERSRSFVAVYVDGDQPGAQKLGTRFAVRGYPTTVLFDPDGRELTRLPGEVDAQQYNELLAVALSARRPAKELLAAARRGGEGLTEADWRLLAGYSWETDQQQLAGKESLATLLRELALACPKSSPALADSAMRLRLKALVATEAKAGPVADAVAQRDPVMALLGDPDRARRVVDVLASSPTELVAALAAAGTPERERLVTALDTALARLQTDPTLSRADRLVALVGRIKVAVPGALNALRLEVREMAGRFDAEIRDGYERQAVVATAAWALEKAGLLDESDALLKANLVKSHSPYYLMSDLADNARKRGDKAAALDWSRQAFDRSEGAATRLQWGVGYLRMLTELAPKDTKRIEAVVTQLIDEASKQPDAFDARSGRSMQRIGKLLRDWDPLGEQAAMQRRLKKRLDAVCKQLPAGDSRTLCDGVFKPGAAA